jgi:hypothetical protein
MSEITPGDLIRSAWLDVEPTPAPEGEVTWTEDAELERRQADYERGFRDGLAASPVVPVGVAKDQEATVVNALIAFANAVEGQSRSRRMALACEHTKALVAALGTKGADHD